MELLCALVIGGLFAIGIYSILRRSLVRMIIGLVLLGQSVNLLIFVAGGMTRGRPALLPSEYPIAEMADPLPQALILTAIVISFGVMAFIMVLLYRSHRDLGSDDLHALKE